MDESYSEFQQRLLDEDLELYGVAYKMQAPDKTWIRISPMDLTIIKKKLPERTCEHDNVSTGSLTRENFWDELMTKFPGDINRFISWIDEYKEAVGWNHLLGKAIKFHDMPIAMQLGIFIQFTCDESHRYSFNEESEGKTIDEYAREAIKEFFFHEDDWSRDEHSRGKYM